MFETGRARSGGRSAESHFSRRDGKLRRVVDATRIRIAAFNGPGKCARSGRHLRTRFHFVRRRNNSESRRADRRAASF